MTAYNSNVDTIVSTGSISKAKNTPLISVIVPNYNHASFLSQRLNSILSQTFNDFEIIVLDDFSGDNSKQIIEAFRSHSKVTHVVYNPFNSGSTFRQWQKGIMLAKGDWIWIAESDDVADPKLLEKLVDLIKKDERCVLAYSATAHIDQAGKNLGLNDWADELDEWRWKSEFRNAGLDEVGKYMRYRNTIPNASAVLFKKEHAAIIDEIATSGMRYTGDWVFWMELLRHGAIYFTPEVLNFQRSHATTSRHWGNISAEVQRIKEYIIAVKKAANITRIKIQWKNDHYQWIFMQCSQNVPYNIKTILVFFAQTFSLSFLKMMLKVYRAPFER